MSETIKAGLREAQGTGASRRLRREGRIPAVLYGNEQEAQAITVEQNAMFYALQRENFHTSILQLEVDGKTYPVIVRDFQMHPFKPAVQHIDFQLIDEKKPLKIRVPLHLKNTEISPAVKLHGGRISQLASSVEIVALPKDIPAALELDMTQVVGGQILHLSDIALPENVKSTFLNRGVDLPVASASGKNRG